VSQIRLALVLGILTAVGPLSIDMYLPAFPAIAAEFGGAGTAETTLAAFFVGLAVGQLTQGPLADRFGRRRPLLAGGAVYVVASVGCALAPGATSFSLFRALAAFGGSAGMVIPRAIVRDVAEGAAAARLMSRLILVMGAAPILAPSLGGLVLQVADWRAIFWVLAAYGVACLALTRFALPETLPPERRVRRNLLGIAGAYAAAASDRTFLAPALASAAGVGAMFAYIAGSPVAFMGVHGLSPATYAVIFGANAACYVGAAQLNAWLLKRHPPSVLLAIAATLLGLASLVLAFTAFTGAGGVAGLVVPLATATGALGVVVPNASALALARQAARAGTASALMGMLAFALGGVAAAGVSLLADGTARPMAVLILLGGIGAVLAERWRRRTLPPRSMG
jgi:DHA1 family bicyclomycin/chloramphenicol resistance-like MFS transporter